MTRPDGDTRQKTDGDIRQKTGFHHGDLREALIGAARRLVIERGAENFSLADACRLAGVSTAAPYKHFRDKNEILREIVTRGFDDLARRTAAAVAQGGVGTLDGIVAMGHAYLTFARQETAIFRLMFGQDSDVKRSSEVESHGRDCFGKVIEQVRIYCDRQGCRVDAHRTALELWTFVHGAASLVIDNDYEKVAPGLDVAGMIASVTPRLLEGSR